MSSANTDSNGVASISYIPWNTGSFQVKAIFCYKLCLITEHIS